MKKFKFLFLSFVLALAGAMFVMPISYSYDASATETALEEADPISDANSFVRVMKNPNNYNKRIKLTQDIHLEKTEDKEATDLSEVWNNVTTFKGEFDGQGHTIYGLTISSKTQNFGLFAKAENATIKNLRIGGDITFDLRNNTNSELTFGVLVGAGSTVKIWNCEVGQILYNGTEKFSKILSIQGEHEVETSEVLTAKQMTFGVVAGSIANGSSISDCVTYVDASLNSNSTVKNNMYVGGISGIVENSTIINAANFSNIEYCAEYTPGVSNPSLEGTTYYLGGIAGEVRFTNSQIWNTVFGGVFKASEKNQTTSIMQGGVCGSIYSTAPTKGNISFNYWLNSQGLEAFGKNENYSNVVEKDENGNVIERIKSVEAIDINLFKNQETNNWHPWAQSYVSENTGWDFDLVWNYPSDRNRLRLQSFQSFKFNFSTDLGVNGILDNSKDEETGMYSECTFDFTDPVSKDHVYKYGDIVVMTLKYVNDKVGYYKLSSIKLGTNELIKQFQFDESWNKNKGIPADHVGVYSPIRDINSYISGYKIAFSASDATDGEYSFGFEDLTFNCYVEIENCDDEDFKARGGVRFGEIISGAGGKTDPKLEPVPLSVESYEQAVSAVAAAGTEWSFKEWQLYIYNGEEFVKENFIWTQSPTFKFKFGEDEHFKIRSDFKLVACFTNEAAIKVTFAGYNREVITDIRFNDEPYTGENAIRLVGENSYDLTFTVAEGYQFDVESFKSFMSTKYGGDSVAALDNYYMSTTDDGKSMYRFSISMASIKKGVGDKGSIEIQLHAITHNEETDDSMLWLWITLPIVGVAAIAGGIVAFFLIRRRNTIRRLGGGNNGGNTTQDKVKKVKIEEVDYKDFFS